MFKTYFKIAYRNLVKHKAYTTLNVFGLSMGIACAILIFAFIAFQLSYDNFHQHSDRIYRLVTEWHDDGVNYSPAVPQPTAKAFRTQYSLDEQTARIVNYRNILVTLDDKDKRKFEEESGINYTEPAFFKIFNFPLAQGNINSILLQPNEAIITEKIAEKYFGNKNNAVGKTFKLSNRTNYTVKGVLKNIPENSFLGSEIFLSYDNLRDQNPWIATDSSWPGVYSGCQAYTLLKPTTTVAQANAALTSIVKEHYSGRDQNIWHFRLQPLDDMHFNPDLNGSIPIKYLWTLGFIALFLLVTACVNFVNLATAQALNRSKEIGIRKTLGSRKMQLFWQFISETALISILATILAYFIAKLAMPQLNTLFETTIPFDLFSDWKLPVFLLLMIVLVTFLSGSYPGIILARFQPVAVLKSNTAQQQSGGISVRRVLVIVQFAISQILIIGTIVITHQVNFSRNADLGFNKESIVVLPIPDFEKSKLSTIKNRFSALPGVSSLTFCYQPPAAQSNNSTGMRYDTRTEDEHWDVNVKHGDDSYVKTFGLKLVAGRNFFPSDTAREVLVNETLVKQLGLKSPNDILGKLVFVNGGRVRAPVVGVIKDFYNYSMHSAISAIVVMPDNTNYPTCAVKINGNNVPATLKSIEAIWNQTFPEYLYKYKFLDDTVADFYRMDAIMLTMIRVFSFIAIIIGCLGLYGLVSFMAVKKTKEVGVRKVLGASLQSILWMFGKEFSKLLLIAFCIAAPVAWWVMNKYLQDFEYRITIGVGIFALAIAITFLIAAFTVGYRSMRAARVNPVKSLRSE